MSFRIFFCLIFLISCGVEGPPVAPEGRFLMPLEYKYTHIPGTCEDDVSKKYDPVCQEIEEQRQKYFSPPEEISQEVENK